MIQILVLFEKQSKSKDPYDPKPFFFGGGGLT